MSPMNTEPSAPGITVDGAYPTIVIHFIATGPAARLDLLPHDRPLPPRPRC